MSEINHPFYVRWLSPFVSFISSYSVNGTNIKVLLTDSDISIPLDSIGRKVKVEKGWFFQTVLITGMEKPLKLFGKEIALQFQNDIRQFVEGYHKERYDELSTASNLIKQEMKRFFSQSRFVKKSHFSAFLQSLTRPEFTKIVYPDLITEEQLNSIRLVEEFFEKPLAFLKKYNDGHVENEINKHQDILHGLNPSQQVACVINDDTNLNLAGAGTGKTKVMVSRANYMIRSGIYLASEILMLAYGSDAQIEMEERIKSIIDDPVTVLTFHKFGKSILETFHKKKMNADKLASDDKALTKFVDNELNRLLEADSDYLDKAITYFDNFLFPYRNPFEFKSLGDYFDYIKSNEIRAFSSDKVKSYEEVIIANFLYRNRIRYEYEPKYKGDITGSGFISYLPDFYLVDYGIYIEHFGVDENMQAPEYMNPTKYLDDMKIKRSIHQKNESKLIETYSFLQKRGKLLDVLKEKLVLEGVVFNPMPASEYLDTLREFGSVSKLGKLLQNALSTSRTMGYGMDELVTIAEDSGQQNTAIALIDLLSPISKSYLAYLKEKEAIDFDSMINDAIDVIRSGNYSFRYKTIMIDEYQDISPPRAKLIKVLMELDPEITLFVVGDDWQGIYRFTGADLQLTYDFFAFFGTGTEVTLSQTYRFNDSISGVATDFITANPKQKKKLIKARPIDRPAVHLVKTITREQQEQIENIIQWLAENVKTGTILLLNRYKYKKPKYLTLLKQQAKSVGFELTFKSVHGSKGKEADYVILMDLNRGKNGFPAEKIDHPLIDMMLPKSDTFPFAEERRLFYVALTRAKEHVFVVSLEDEVSSFARELLQFGDRVSTNTLESTLGVSNISNESCPVCKTGLLISRESKHGRFVGCTNWSLCDYTYNNCAKCGSRRKIVDEYHVCQNSTCNHKSPVCDKCGNEMTRRTNGPYGPFWGCNKYPLCENKRPDGAYLN